MKGVCRKGHRISGDNACKRDSTGQVRCVKCKREYNLKWHRKARGGGWTTNDYDLAMVKQKGKCAICGKPPENKRRMCGDHNHTTGEKRELLCNHCNMFLGTLENNADLVKKAEEYLLKHNAQ